jgi:hypothetical protein
VRRRAFAAAVAAGTLLVATAGCSQTVVPPPTRAPDVPYEPSPPAVVRAMLELAGVKPDDVVYDLGCGDGS